MENSKMTFANTINELGSNGAIGASECHNFGSTWGCRPDCPVFERGECKDVYRENLEMFIRDCEIGFQNEDEFLVAMSMYKDRLSSEQVNELTALWAQLT